MGAGASVHSFSSFSPPLTWREKDGAVTYGGKESAFMPEKNMGKVEQERSAIGNESIAR